MANTTFTFRVDDDLKANFAETARAEDRTAAQLLRVLMREAVRRRQEADAAAQRAISVRNVRTAGRVLFDRSGPQAVLHVAAPVCYADCL